MVMDEGVGFAEVGGAGFSDAAMFVGAATEVSSCPSVLRAAMPERIALAAGAFPSEAGALFSDSSGVNSTSSVSPVRMGLVKSALTPLTRSVKVTRLVAGGGVKPTARSASLTFAVPVPF